LDRFFCQIKLIQLWSCQLKPLPATFSAPQLFTGAFVSLLRKTVFYSMLIFCFFTLQLQGANAESVGDTVARVEKIIQQDPGNRGVGHFYTQALFDATQCLEKADHVAILTGFFIPAAQPPETDGPLGSMFLAESLIARGKKVTIITDSYCLPAITACYDVIKEKLNPDSFTVSIFPDDKNEQETFASTLCSTIDCLVSIERVGRSKDATYRTMRGIDITQKTAPLDDLFIYAHTHPEMHITTIAVGDGGNEIGMGGKQDDVKQYVSQGELIACVVPSDHLIVTGVSNWGGYALAAALWCTIDEQEREMIPLEQVYPSNEEQFQMLESMIQANCCDGVLGKPVLSVDGMAWDVHQKILDDIREIIR
jgi:hypothetical protein